MPHPRASGVQPTRCRSSSFHAAYKAVVAAALARSIEEDLFGAVLPNFARALYLGGAEIAE